MARHGAWALLVVIPVLSGCITDDGADEGAEAPLTAATLLCYPASDVAAKTSLAEAAQAEACNLQATVDPVERQANELSIAVNPTDPLNIIATGKDYNPSHAGECVWDGIYTTHDGGKTWTNQNLPGSNWKRLEDPSYPIHPEFSRFWCATDPVVAFGPDGTAYWTVMPYQCDRLSGSRFGREFVPGTGIGHPQGGFNDWLWTCSSMYVLVSRDGGDTWPLVREVAFGARLEHDKQWISVAPDGTVLLCWDRSDNVGDTGTPAEQLKTPGSMVCSVSKDQGESWAEWQPVNPDWTGFLPWVDWDSKDHAWLAALDGANVLVSHSEDGLVWEQPVVVGHYTDPPPNGEYGWPALNGSVFRTFAVPSLAVDRSGGPRDGDVYVVWMDHSGGDADVLFTRGSDHGANWTAPVRVHHDEPALRIDQFMPAASVGPDGTIDVVWYDRRDDPQHHLLDLYYTYSLDGGETFAPELRVTELSSDEQYSHHQNGMIFLGDYIDIDSSPGRAHLVWVDTRNGKADAFVATVERPRANPST